ncbi:MAG: hypothetical protein QXF52_02815 [Thermoproteota archaeon]
MEVGEVILPAFYSKVRRKPVGLARRRSDLPTLIKIQPDVPIGLINFKVIPVKEDEDTLEEDFLIDEGFTVYVNNYTGFWRKPMEGKIHTGRTPVPVKVWRIMDPSKNDWIDQEYVITVVTKNYFGSRLIRIKPDKPIINIEVKVHLSRKEGVSSETSKRFLKPFTVSEIFQPLPVDNSVVEEEVIRIKTYLAMLEGEKNCGLISERAYYRLRRRLESILYELLDEAEKPIENLRNITIRTPNY